MVLNVYVQIYGHEYGTDFAVYTSEADALDGATNIVSDYVDDLDGPEPGTAEHVRDLLKKAYDDFDANGEHTHSQLERTAFKREAVRLYCDATEEWFDGDYRSVAVNDLEMCAKVMSYLLDRAPEVKAELAAHALGAKS
jgi:hypothetical protein